VADQARKAEQLRRSRASESFDWDRAQTVAMRGILRPTARRVWKYLADEARMAGAASLPARVAITIKAAAAELGIEKASLIRALDALTRNGQLAFIYRPEFRGPSRQAWIVELLDAPASDSLGCRVVHGDPQREFGVVEANCSDSVSGSASDAVRLPSRKAAFENCSDSGAPSREPHKSCYAQVGIDKKVAADFPAPHRSASASAARNVRPVPNGKTSFTPTPTPTPTGVDGCLATVLDGYADGSQAAAAAERLFGLIERSFNDPDLASEVIEFAVRMATAGVEDFGPREMEAMVRASFKNVKTVPRRKFIDMLRRKSIELARLDPRLRWPFKRLPGATQ
jgi:hypothetical protein